MKLREESPGHWWFGAFLFSLWGCSVQNWSPYSTVEGIAEEYNGKLVVEIRKKF